MIITFAIGRSIPHGLGSDSPVKTHLSVNTEVIIIIIITNLIFSVRTVSYTDRVFFFLLGHIKSDQKFRNLQMDRENEASKIFIIYLYYGYVSDGWRVRFPFTRNGLNAE